MTLLDDLLTDLAAEGDQLRTAVAGLDDQGWRAPTPALGWDVSTQIGHLTWTDTAAVAAATDAVAWETILGEAITDPDSFVDRSAATLAALPHQELLVRWDAGRVGLVTALRAVPDGLKLPWFGPPMAPTSMATARFMETWAHGQDVYDALGVVPERTDRVRHVCHLGVRTRGFAYAAHGQEPPAEEIRVELTGPSGATWTWGPPEARQRVTGQAWEFALLVTQRIHRDDTDLVAHGPDASYWLSIAQAFAGPPGLGRAATR